MQPLLKSFSLILIFSIQISLMAQNAGDVMLMLDGNENIGSVTEIGDDYLKFVHRGEALTYTFKKSDILKITFASGRIEFFNKPEASNSIDAASNKDQPNNSADGSLASHHNKVGILPFMFLEDNSSAGQEMTFKVQNEAYAILSSHLGNLKLQDPNTTNALLIKAGVNNNNRRGFTMGEICNILDVEYVIQGTIAQNKTSTSSSSYSRSSYQSAEKSGSGSSANRLIGAVFSRSGKAASSSSTSTTDHYETSITMSVYTDKGDSIFSKDHTSMWDSNDAYKITLKYLLKRTPIYRK